MGDTRDIPAVYQLLAQAAGQVGHIAKSERNKEQGFDYRSIEDITARVQAVFAELGLAMVPQVRSHRDTEVESKRGAKGYRVVVLVDYTVYGPDGSSCTATMVGEAVDYGDKATSKAVQMAYKYALTELLHIGAGGDPDQQAVEAGHRPSHGAIPSPVTLLKKQAASQFGRDAAAAAWAQLFEDGDPDPDSLTEARATEVMVALEALVEQAKEAGA